MTSHLWKLPSNWKEAASSTGVLFVDTGCTTTADMVATPCMDITFPVTKSSVQIAGATTQKGNQLVQVASTQI